MLHPSPQASAPPNLPKGIRYVWGEGSLGTRLLAPQERSPHRLHQTGVLGYGFAVHRYLLFFTALFLSVPCVLHAKKPDPTSCIAGEHWVRAYHRRAYIRADGTPISASHVEAHCRKNPVGYDYWAKRLRSGLPPDWSYPEEKPKAWTEEEKERLLEAFGELPEVLWVSTIEGVYRLERSRFFPNPAAGEPKKVAFYDTAFSQKQKLAQILAHELAHELFRNLSVEERKSYLKATLWFELRQNGKVTSTIRGRSDRFFVAIDGTDSPTEDFSNNLEYFLFEPRTLERVTPQAFKWFRENYGDKMKLHSGRK